MSELLQQHCISPKEGLQRLNADGVEAYLKQVDGWQRDKDAIQKEFRFKDFYQTIAFVNALAWIANREDHHPDLEVGYNRCMVRYTTHAVDGLSQNDFICAARIDALNR
jgi:4a-hydroxytetrahydrobiopterin dehydratase